MKCGASLQKKTSAGPRSSTGSPSAPPNGMLDLICLAVGVIGPFDFIIDLLDTTERGRTRLATSAYI